MLGASFGSAAKGTGLKALEFALSVCDSVDMYGFTVDPGYKEWLVLFFVLDDYIYYIDVSQHILMTHADTQHIHSYTIIYLIAI